MLRYSKVSYFCSANDMGLVTVRCLTARVAESRVPVSFLWEIKFYYIRTIIFQNINLLDVNPIGPSL